ncbi:uncharacterized protein K460DRAFT_377306 [Cucurbitaria berberidis CBS 394.84]|uniref:Zn(2)-C6 fungal-type domain-containing protein n=1 Tax=Cucurbitaria berberidis CBS 394.84 TaxID=1168544 RepID=A0A9P4GHZ0_9PLEO|nr:uncharacterized protein K460DRAFT_377306 [Cucurbitaria berberidis CBS 394.84]KAF1845987.1 hypothetical protein K460DRAFT_377306 [Cucurbitaria berberidis CBS 394.84]
MSSVSPPTPAPTATTTATATATATAPTSSQNSRRVPLDKRKRTETSCDKCKSRKQKCRKEPGQDSCRYCSENKIECMITKPRKKRLYGSVEGLGNRLALLESLVKGLLPEADVSNMDEMRELGNSLGIQLPDSMDNDANGEQKSSSDREGEESMSLLPDQQGQVQYIGPASSFSFHLKLRTLVGKGAPREFVLFGRNAADQEPLEGDSDPHSLSTPSASATSNIDHTSPTDRRTSTSTTEAPSLESLIGAFFDYINPDFPVLHEASFREAYEAWVANPGQADPAWLCGFLCVLLLARRVARVSFPEDQERMWWRRVQTLLPVVIFTSSVMAVQAMMLAAMHLHNTNHRDACWNLTGTAIRIAFAIGLHQDKVSTLQTPLARELRKRLWWTLYAFEQMQVSSYDRPSAIEHPASKISCPNERIIGMASYSPEDYCKWFNRMVVHLGSACRAPKTMKSNASEESYVGALSPAAGVLRDLERWKDSIPQHLQMDALKTSPLAFQRPLLLLHAMYHYTVTVLCRAALLARATILSKEGKDSVNPALIAMAQSCSDSGRDLGRIMLKLEAIGKFDAITWWDIWYTLASSSVLVLDFVCLDKLANTDRTTPRILLAELAELAQRHRKNPHMPGTIEKFASIIPELYSMAGSMNNASFRAITPKVEIDDTPGPSRPPQQSTQEDLALYPYHHSSSNSGAYMFANNAPGRFYPEQEYIGTTYPNARLERTTQMQFMDFTINNIHDWNWGDLGSLLGNEGAQNLPAATPGPHLPGPT